MTDTADIKANATFKKFHMISKDGVMTEKDYALILPYLVKNEDQMDQSMWINGRLWFWVQDHCFEDLEGTTEWRFRDHQVVTVGRRAAHEVVIFKP